jgi:hypothetical protein
MAEKPIAARPEDEPNPYAPPQSDFSDRSRIVDPEVEALRRAHLKDESYVKALTIVNLAYAVALGVYLINRAQTLVLHLSGRTPSPWIVRPVRLAEQLVDAVTLICALGAACGFFMRKRWALRFELVLALGFFLNGILEPLLHSRPAPILTFIGPITLGLMLAAPMLEVSRLRRSVVFDPAYARTVKATAHIKAWPKLSRRLTLIMVILFVAVLVLGFLGRAR